MTYEERNVIIARFMGPGNPVRYQASWSDLMPVWRRIMHWGVKKYGEHWRQDITMQGVVIGCYLPDEQNHWIMVHVTCPVSGPEITHVYHAVTLFLEQYYENKK